MHTLGMARHVGFSVITSSKFNCLLSDLKKCCSKGVWEKLFVFSFIYSSPQLELHILELHPRFRLLDPMVHTTRLLAHHTASSVVHPLLANSLDLLVQVYINYI